MTTKWKIGIIGAGNVGTALQKGLVRAGYETKIVAKNPQGVRETATWADVIIMAVPFGAIDATLGEVGTAVNGKTVVDVTNAFGTDMQLAIGFSTSAAEELQKKVRGAKVVKAFNTVFATEMDSGHAKGQALTTFVAGDDVQAKTQVLQMARDIGFDAVDSGPLRNARMIEPMGALNVYLGYGAKMGRDIGLKLVH